MRHFIQKLLKFLSKLRIVVIRIYWESAIVIVLEKSIVTLSLNWQMNCESNATIIGVMRMSFSEGIDNAEQCNHLARSCWKWTIMCNRTNTNITRNTRSWCNNLLVVWERARVTNLRTVFNRSNFFFLPEDHTCYYGAFSQGKISDARKQSFQSFPHETKEHFATIFAFFLSVKKDFWWVHILRACWKLFECKRVEIMSKKGTSPFTASEGSAVGYHQWYHQW